MSREILLEFGHQCDMMGFDALIGSSQFFYVSQTTFFLFEYLNEKCIMFSRTNV